MNIEGFTFSHLRDPILGAQKLRFFCDFIRETRRRGDRTADAMRGKFNERMDSARARVESSKGCMIPGEMQCKPERGRSDGTRKEKTKI